MINHQQLIDLVRQTRGTTAVTIECLTEVKLKKSAPFQVFKNSIVNGMVGYIYENSVNYQRQRENVEPSFSAQPRTWGTRLDRFFVEHNGQLYLTIKVENTIYKDYENEEGEFVDYETIAPHMYARSSSSRQGVSKKIIHRDYKLSSIKSITINGNKYDISQED